MNIPRAGRQAAASKGSLRSRMLLRVLVPLALTWAVSIAVALAVASSFTRQAFDRSLLDDAYALAATVREQAGRPVLDLSDDALRSILFDQTEAVYYAVFEADGRLVSGNAELPHSLPPEGARPEFSEHIHDGHRLRLATLRREQPLPFIVVVGQTTRSHSDLLQHLLLALIAPQLGLLLLLGLWVRQSIGRELKPLSELRVAVAERRPTDLSPVEVAAESRDLLELTHAVNVAHELRNPLAGIRALVDYGLGQDDPAVWRQQLCSIATSQQRASRLIDQLLALALADEGHEGLPLQPVQMDEVVRDCILQFLPRADAARMDLGAVGLDVSVRALGRIELVEGVVNNLVDNALRYARPADGSEGRITVELRQEADQVVLSVTDTGPGIEPRSPERSLPRWSHRSPRVHSGAGAGLGLAIVSRYAVLLGGFLSLSESPSGGGLCAKVTLHAA